MTYDEHEQRIHTAGATAMVREAARIRAGLCASRNLPLSSGCLRGFRLSDFPDLPLQVVEVDSEGGETD